MTNNNDGPRKHVTKDGTLLVNEDAVLFLALGSEAKAKIADAIKRECVASVMEVRCRRRND